MLPRASGTWKVGRLEAGGGSALTGRAQWDGGATSATREEGREGWFNY